MRNRFRRPGRGRNRSLRLRAALCAAAATAVVAPAASLAASGGVATPGSTPTKTTEAPAAPASKFGSRTLRPGMSGSDVYILNGIVASKTYAPSVELSDVFESPTAAGVREFQTRRGLRANGIVNPETAQALTASMKLAEASWYGPGLWGNGTACGQTLRPSTLGVAHKTLPCGTKVTFAYQGRHVVARVIDRGPFIAGRTWDLTKAASDAIGMTPAGIADVRYAVDR